MMTKVCLSCGNEYKTYKSHFERRKYCSSRCNMKANRNVVIAAAIKAITGKTTSNKQKLVASNRWKGSGNPNFGKDMSGPKHPNWIADRSLLLKKQERNDSAYKEWRMSVWKRDEFKCRVMSHECRGRLEAHHILSWSEHPELRYNINNGITLCHAHHPRRRAEEKRLVPFFMDLVSVSNEKFCQSQSQKYKQI